MMAEPVETPRRNLTGAIVPALAAAALAAVGAIAIVSLNGRGGPTAAQTAAADLPPGVCILEHADALGGPIDLVDTNGGHVTQADFAGERALVFFGFTHCPDICPSTMYTVAEVLGRPGSYDAQAILITVDPERDTPDVMRAYTQTDGFPVGLVGLTGTRAQTSAAERAFGASSSRIEIPGAPANSYNVSHSFILYAMDENWRTVAGVRTMTETDPMIPGSPLRPTTPEEISACLAAGYERAARQGASD